MDWVGLIFGVSHLDHWCVALIILYRCTQRFLDKISVGVPYIEDDIGHDGDGVNHAKKYIRRVRKYQAFLFPAILQRRKKQGASEAQMTKACSSEHWLSLWCHRTWLEIPYKSLENHWSTWWMSQQTMFDFSWRVVHAKLVGLNVEFTDRPPAKLKCVPPAEEAIGWCSKQLGQHFPMLRQSLYWSQFVDYFPGYHGFYECSLVFMGFHVFSWVSRICAK